MNSYLKQTWCYRGNKAHCRQKRRTVWQGSVCCVACWICSCRWRAKTRRRVQTSVSGIGEQNHSIINFLSIFNGYETATDMLNHHQPLIDHEHRYSVPPHLLTTHGWRIRLESLKKYKSIKVQ
jgi:hypothetical protein